MVEWQYQRQLRATKLGLVMLGLIAVGGTAGYMALERWTFGDSLYMVIITLSTVGFREIRQLSDPGRYLTATLIVTGLGTLAYVGAAFTRLVVEGELQFVLGRRRMDKEISRLVDHFIVCGYGRVGREVCRNLQADDVPFVVIDVDPEALDDLSSGDIPHVQGNAIEEAVLERAGIDRARGLLLTLSNEADNVYVTLLAKERRRDLPIIARSITEQGERRLVAAGVNRVVSPERIGARSMSNFATRPSTVEFTEIITARQNLGLQLEEQRLGETSQMAGKSIEECRIRRDFGLIVVGILTPEKDMIFNPSPAYRLEAGSTLIMLGRQEDLRRFASLT